MSNFTLQFVLGKPPGERPGQWIEGSVEFGEGSFEISADVCRRFGPEEFSMYRVHERLGLPFTAELFLGVLSLLADGEFRPIGSGLELSYSGEGAAPTKEIARILEPNVRSDANPAVVPAENAEQLREQLTRLSRHRRMLRGTADLHLDLLPPGAAPA